jgi:hypothetical protein
MADNKLLQQMLESLVNDDQAKAEELFHEYVVQQSREIYESMIDSEIAEEEEKDEEDEEVEEASDDEEKEEDKVEENFEDMAYEGDDEMDLDSEDPTDDLAGELGGEEGEESEEGEEQLFQDLEAIVDELQAKFDELKGVEGDEQGDDMGDMGDDEGGNPFAKQEGIDDLETVREYVEKVPAGHGAEKKGQAEKADGNGGGLKFSKNDMGGTAANILGGKNGSDAGMQGMSGDLKGSGLLKGKPQPQDGGNINVPGAKNGNAFSKKEPGHGAEKAGSKESADNKQSLFRGRR